MKKIFWSLLLIISVAGKKAVAQHADILEALARNGKINTKLPIIDSLLTFKASKKQLSDIQKKFDLSSREVSEIHELSKRNKGEKLNVSDIPGTTLISALLWYKGDTSRVTFMERYKPFYILSIPTVFGHGDMAVVDIDLIGGGGYTYLLIKQQGQWVIKGELVRWVV